MPWFMLLLCFDFERFAHFSTKLVMLACSCCRKASKKLQNCSRYHISKNYISVVGLRNTPQGSYIQYPIMGQGFFTLQPFIQYEYIYVYVKYINEISFLVSIHRGENTNRTSEHMSTSSVASLLKNYLLTIGNRGYLIHTFTLTSVK